MLIHADCSPQWMFTPYSGYSLSPVDVTQDPHARSGGYSLQWISENVRTGRDLVQ